MFFEAHCRPWLVFDEANYNTVQADCRTPITDGDHSVTHFAACFGNWQLLWLGPVVRDEQAVPCITWLCVHWKVEGRGCAILRLRNDVTASQKADMARYPFNATWVRENDWAQTWFDVCDNNAIGMGFR
jgi:hypothetical protein